jgi:alkaline phosphatase
LIIPVRRCRCCPIILPRKKIKTGVITCGDIADATPADFYAHQVERTNSASVLQDLRNADINLLMGADDQDPENIPAQEKPNSYRNQIKSMQTDFTVVPSMDSINTADKKWIVIDQQAARPALRGRGNWLERAFTKSIQVLSENKQGFLLVAEGAQVDHGGHDNNLPYVASEVMDFDQVVGRALQFADENMETLVIVTADHETGGLSLLDGDYNTGYVSGQFSTNDHTAIPVTVFAYGPQSQLFRGVYENTALFNKILQAYGINVGGNGH